MKSGKTNFHSNQVVSADIERIFLAYSASFDPSDRHVDREVRFKPSQSRKVGWFQLVRKISFRFWLLFFVAIITASILMVWPSGARSSQPADAMSIAGILLFATVLAGILLAARLSINWFQSSRLKRRERADSDYVFLPVVGESLKRAQSLISQGMRDYDPYDYWRVSTYMREPYLINSRTGHSITQDGVVFDHKIAKKILHENRDGSHFVISHSSIKGVLTDSFAITANGKSCSTVSIEDARALQVASMTVWRDALAKFETAPSNDGCWLALMSAICCDIPILDQSPVFLTLREDESLEEVNAVTAAMGACFSDILSYELDRMVRSGAEKDLCIELIEGIRHLSRSNLIWVKLSDRPEGWNRIEYRFREHLNYNAQHRYDRLRIRLGLVPRNFDIPVGAAMEAQSYHLDFSTPDGMYLYESALHLAETDSRSSVDVPPISRESSDSADLLSLRSSGSLLNPIFKASRTGSGLAQVYTRGLGGLRIVDKNQIKSPRPVAPSVSFEFREIPPGNLLWSAIMAAYLSGVAWLVGANYNQVFLPNGEIKTTWAAVVFGIPAILAGLLISKFTGGRIHTVSLVTMLAISGTVMNAVLLVGIASLAALNRFVLPLSLGHLDEKILSFDLRFEFDFASLSWSLVMLSTGLNLGVILLLMARKGHKFVERLSS
ncbi:hypothetical protein HQO27_17820 [Rhodococcus fascians]|nr:hypothetical protein [Rhodococcus fascians]MBY4432626.1 hypothetical protein [Rhodococcus fascians]